jgi:hypothetical protein
MPTLIIWGDSDDIIPIEHAHQAHAAMPGSRLEIFQGVGHFPHVEAPQRFVEVLGDFIASTEPASGDLETYRELLREGAPPGVPGPRSGASGKTSRPAGSAMPTRKTAKARS